MKKSLKTKIAAALLAVSTAVASSAPAFAADTNTVASNPFNELFTNNAIDILYNGDIITYTDVTPQNINDRVMIPFRAVLETMGAEVQYDDAQRMVTAVRGGTTIKFSLDGDTISVNTNGTESQIKMDVPLAVVNDRTLVPIRFISNAFGMNVGWNSDAQAVLILDVNSYINELKALPNIAKLMEMNSEVAPKSNSSFSLEVNSTGDFTFDSKLSTAFDVICTNGVIGGNGIINLDIDGLNQLINMFGESDVKLSNLENVKLDIAADEGVVYFKTDLFEKLAVAYPNEKIASVAKFADSNTWFKWDMAKTFNDMAKKDAAVQPLADLINNGITGLNNIKLEDVFTDMLSADGDVTIEQMMMAETLVTTYSIMDKNMTITVADNGDYNMTIDMNKDAFKELLLSSGADEEALSTITLSLKGSSEKKDNKAVSNVDYNFSIMGVNIIMKADSTSDYSAIVETPSVPKTAIDVEDIIKALE